MKRTQLSFEDGFRIVEAGAGAQAAVMTLGPGTRTGGPQNTHDGSDQWLFVVEGTGVAVVEDAAVDLRPGTLLLIEKGEAHEIRNTGAAPLCTLNLYVPPVY